MEGKTGLKNKSAVAETISSKSLGASGMTNDGPRRGMRPSFPRNVWTGGTQLQVNTKIPECRCILLLTHKMKQETYFQTLSF